MYKYNIITEKYIEIRFVQIDKDPLAPSAKC